MDQDGHGILWTQVILAAALARAAIARSPGGENEETVFAFADTHAGGGVIAVPDALAAVLAARDNFAVTAFHDAIGGGPAGQGGHPGSWVLAGRVLAGEGRRLAVEIDVNDIDPVQIARAREARELGWVRFWSHDWFLFLRNRVSMPRRPDFVFIDPPPDDPRGPGYAIDAAILLETLAIPYMITYPAASAQAAIDQIGRLGLELSRDGGGQGAVLGGGAETVVLDILGDLGRLAAVLGGRFAPRLPRPPADDYCI